MNSSNNLLMEWIDDESFYRNGIYYLRLYWAVGKVGCRFCDFINSIHAFRYLAESSISTVQVRRVFVHDKVMM